MPDPTTGAGPSTSGSGVLSAKTLSSARAAGILSQWKLTPATMMAHLDRSWIPAPWLQYLSLEIAKCIASGSCGLLISAPPRHGKSQLSTIATPLWVLENFPSKSVVVATYGEELSTDFTRQIRDLIQQNQGELNVRLRADARRVTNILTTEGGGLKAVGLQGTITGRGADVLVIDDYIKNPKEAMSPAYLDDLWDWWRTVARTRLEPGAVVIILATRWVANDLHGRIMKQQRENGRSFFRYIEMPAIFEAPLIVDPSGALDDKGAPLLIPDSAARDMIGRCHGEVLFPQRYNTQTILDIRTELGSRWFGAMFQQRPRNEEGKVFNPDWMIPITAAEFERRYAAMLEGPSKGRLVWGRSWDLASTKEAGDYTSGVLALYNKDTHEFYIRAMARGQWSSHTVEDKFSAVTRDDYRTFFRHVVEYKVGIEQEPGSSGEYTINHFQKLLAKDAEKGLESVPIKIAPFKAAASSGKLLNAQPVAAAAEAGKVYLVGDTNENGALVGWAKDLYDEIESFPEGEHDDQVDALSQVYKMLTGKKILKPTFGREGANRGAPAESKEITARRPVRLTFGRKLIGVR